MMQKRQKKQRMQKRQMGNPRRDWEAAFKRMAEEGDDVLLDDVLSNDWDEEEWEWDFSEGVRGKHHQAFQEGYQVTIHKKDGTTEVRDFGLPEGTVILEPDVREHFPDSETVNRALRELIPQ